MAVMYTVPVNECTAEYEIKNSLFIATVRQIISPDTMKEFVKEMRSNHPKANHTCWAMIYGSPSDSNTFGFSDDGEPTGTAGKPIFTVLQHSGIGQVGITVTRYFGGIKLGTGGLVKAYTESAKVGLERVITTPYSPLQAFKIAIPYGDEPHLRYLLQKREVTGEFNYGSNVECLLKIGENEASSILSYIREQIGINATIEQQFD